MDHFSFCIFRLWRAFLLLLLLGYCCYVRLLLSVRSMGSITLLVAMGTHMFVRHVFSGACIGFAQA